MQGTAKPPPGSSRGPKVRAPGRAARAPGPVADSRLKSSRRKRPSCHPGPEGGGAPVQEVLSVSPWKETQEAPDLGEVGARSREGPAPDEAQGWGRGSGSRVQAGVGAGSSAAPSCARLPASGVLCPAPQRCPGPPSRLVGLGSPELTFDAATAAAAAARPAAPPPATPGRSGLVDRCPIKRPDL